MDFIIGPGGVYRWVAAPGTEIVDIDLVTGQYRWLIDLQANNTTSSPVRFSIQRGPKGELLFSPGIYPIYYDGRGIMEYKKEEKYVLPEPDFDLDEIHKAQSMINEDRGI